ncbi:MAG: MATE family efflux transporter [Spirochaetes bacterium]|jgi:putative MATE family efflux protein|nr:MATE family efflux transporter [Spirochaetota bacterium]
MSTPASEITNPRELYATLLRLATPIMLANLFQMFYNLADAFFLGRIGREAVSAVAISFNIVMLIVVVGSGLATAGQTLISQSRGRGDQKRVDFYLGQMTTSLLGFSLIISLAGGVLIPALLALLQVPPDAFPQTQQYLRIIFAGLPFMFLFFVMQAAMQGIGDSMTPLLIQAGTIVLNIALDPLLIFGVGPLPRMEVAGAAVATVISRSMGSAVALLILLRGGRGLHLKLRNLIPKPAAVRLFFRVGAPISVGQGLSGLGFVVLQGIVNGFGTAVIAAFGVGTRIIGLFNMPAIGFSRATASLVGQSIGAGRPDQAKTVLRQSVLTILAFMSVGMTLTFFFGNLVVRFFVDDAAVVEVGAVMFRVVSISVIPFALFTVANGAFQGGGDTKPVMYLNVARLWGLRVPVAYVLAVAIGIGPLGVWMSMVVSNVVIAAAGFWILSKGRWLTALDQSAL